MELEIGKGKKGRRAYGFDDIAIVPSRRTRDPDDIDITWMLGPYRFELPLLAAAMDGVVSPATAIELGVRVLITGPDALEVEHGQATELADPPRGVRRDDAVHRRRQERQLEPVRAEHPGDVDVIRIARAP